MRDFYFVPTMRFELTTSSLPRKRSTPELSRLGKKNHIPLIWNVIFLERKTGVEPATFSLEGWRSTNWATSAICVYKLLLVNGVQIYKIFLNLQIKFIKKWGEQDSNLRSRKTAELQSDPFGHSGISPLVFFINYEPPEGFEPTTPRLQITCSGQLSYGGKIWDFKRTVIPFLRVQI